MLSRYAKAFFTRLLTRSPRSCCAVGISPDVVTWIGTLGVVVRRARLLPPRRVLLGHVVITAFVFSDILDGTMARLSGRSSRWGAFLDSTLDRVGDAAIFGGSLLWCVRAATTSRGSRASRLSAWSAALVVSYAKARAEGLGHDLRRRDRRAHRAAGRRRWSPPGSPGSSTRRGSRRSACGCWRSRTVVTVGAADRRTCTARQPTADAAGDGAVTQDAVTDWAFAAGWAAVRRHAGAGGPRDCSTAFADQAWLRHGDVGAAARAQPAPGRAGRVRRASCASCPAPAMRSYLRYWCEAFRLPDLEPRADRGDASIVRRRAPARRGARPPAAAWSLALPHMGNWDHAGAWVSARRTVRSRRSPSGSSPSRCTSGSSPTAGARHGGAAADRRGGPFRTLLRAAPRAAGPGLPARRPRPDRERRSRSTFFGERATMPAGPAALAVAHRRRAAAGHTVVRATG